MTGASSSETPSTAAGSRYELLLKIASGGTATVYVARETALDRLVAVKRAHPHLLEEPETRRMLLEEARLASRIRHANVASVHDVEETANDLLLVMEYVEGASLAHLLEVARAEGAPFPPQVAVRVLIDAANGLAAVHELVGDDGRSLGMVHRDVSPQNVLVGLDGTSRVADFGLARLHSPRDVSRTTGPLEGKLAYLAPELLDGKRCTPKSELFALGVVLWESLTSRRLFRGETDADTMRRLLRTEVPRVSKVAPHVGASLDALLERALARDPAARHVSVRAFAMELEATARKAGLVGTTSEVAATVEAIVGPSLERRRTVLRGSLVGARRRGVGGVAQGGEAPSPRDAMETLPETSDSAHARQPAPSTRDEATVPDRRPPRTPAAAARAHRAEPETSNTARFGWRRTGTAAEEGSRLPGPRVLLGFVGGLAAIAVGVAIGVEVGGNRRATMLGMPVGEPGAAARGTAAVGVEPRRPSAEGERSGGTSTTNTAAGPAPAATSVGTEQRPQSAGTSTPVPAPTPTVTPGRTTPTAASPTNVGGVPAPPPNPYKRRGP